MHARWRWYAVAAAALVVFLLGMLRQRAHAALPADFARDAAAAPFRLGSDEAGTREELEFLVQRDFVPGDRARIGSARGDAEVVLWSELSPGLFVVTLASGLCYWAIALLVFVPRIDRRPARTGFACLLLAGLAISVGGVYFPTARGPPGPGALGTALFGLDVLALALLPVAFVHLSLVFPREHPVLARRRRLVPAAAGFGALVAAALIAAYVRYFGAPSPRTWEAVAWSKRVADAWLVAGMATGVACLWASGRRAESLRERQQARWILWGIGLGATPFVFLRTLPRVLGYDPGIGPAVDRVVELAVPASFAIAVARHRFLDIDVILRRSAIATALAAVLVGAWLLVAIVAGTIAGLPLPETAPWASLATAAVAVALFEPTRRAVSRFVDRRFFRLRFGHESALAAFAAKAVGAAGPRDVCAGLRGLLEEALRPKAVLVLARDGAGVEAAGHPTWATASRFSRLVETFAGGAPPQARARPQSTCDPGLEAQGLPADVDDPAVRVIQPIVRGGRCLGLILLGERASGRRWVEEDLSLLERGAAEAAAALDRVGLVRRVAEEGVARRALDELNRLKTDFLLRAAHDLRTPIAAIRWSADNLLDGVCGEVNPAQRETLDSVRAASRHLARLVSNLVEAGRLESGEVRLRSAPVRLDGVVAEALKGLAPLARERRVTFDVRLDRDAGRIRGDGERLVEVVVNLVENALKYAPPGTAVEGRVDRDDSGGARLSVRDHGPGIDPADADALFERFRRGRASPHSSEKGLGLGLHIVRSYVTLMGGRVAAGNHATGGAEFTVVLPRFEDGKGEGA